MTQSYRYVILPIALRLIIPPGTNESLNLLKNSSVALTISVAELTFQTRQIETYTAKAIEALTAGTLIYLVLCVSIAAVMALGRAPDRHSRSHHGRTPARMSLDFSVSSGGTSTSSSSRGFSASATSWAARCGWPFRPSCSASSSASSSGWRGCRAGRGCACRRRCYVEFFRGVPLVMVIFWIWFIIPIVLKTKIPEFGVALTAFVIFEAAYLGEIVRAGVQSVPRGQVEAATAVGLSSSQDDAPRGAARRRSRT